MCINLAHAQNINQIFTQDFLACVGLPEWNSPFMQLQKNKKWFTGVLGYKKYSTLNMVQQDFSVNFKYKGLHVVKLSSIDFRGNGLSYYLIFENSLSEIKKNLNFKNSHAEFSTTPKGNIKLACGVRWVCMQILHMRKILISFLRKISFLVGTVHHSKICN